MFSKLHQKSTGWAGRKMVSAVFIAIVCLGAVYFATGLIGTGSAQNQAEAPVSTAFAGVPASQNGLPRFASLKADKVNVRRGPSRDHEVVWIFNKAGLPVEIVAEFENWRRIRDSEGSEGWVFHTLLSNRRTALVKPWAKDEVESIRATAGEAARVVALVQPGVVLDVEECTGLWCLAHAGEVTGWIMQESLWGVYPNEVAKF